MARPLRAGRGLRRIRLPDAQTTPGDEEFLAEARNLLACRSFDFEFVGESTEVGGGKAREGRGDEGDAVDRAFPASGAHDFAQRFDTLPGLAEYRKNAIDSRSRQH